MWGGGPKENQVEPPPFTNSHLRVSQSHQIWLSTMNVLVIGGTGFIGQHATERIASRDHQVTVFSRGHTSPDLPDSVQFIHGDRDEIDQLRQAVGTVGPDVVLDLIPYTAAQAKALVSACEGQTGRLVVLSSGDVYRQYDGLRGESDDPPDPVPLSEGAPLRTSRFPYRGMDTEFAYADDYDKILVEEHIQSADLSSTILRLPKVYGPGDHEHHVGEALARLRSANGELILSEKEARWRWSRGYVSNVAAAIAESVTNPIAAGRTYNVGEPDALPQATWLAKLADVAGLSVNVRTVPGDEFSDPSPFNWNYSMALDTRRVRTELKFAEPISHQQALVRTVLSESQ